MPRARQLLVPVLVAFACATAALAADPAPHRLVRIDISSPADADFVRANRGLLDVIHFKPGVSVDIAADARALAFLRASGRSLEVVEETAQELQVVVVVDGHGVPVGQPTGQSS